MKLRLHLSPSQLLLRLVGLRACHRAHHCQAEGVKYEYSSSFGLKLSLSLSLSPGYRDVSPSLGKLPTRSF